MTGGVVSRNKVTGFLSGKELNSPKLWRLVKPLVHEIKDKASEEEDVLIIDDRTIEEKTYAELESEFICWHYDHSQEGLTVKGVNLFSMRFRVGDISVPVACELVKKTR